MNIMQQGLLSSSQDAQHNAVSRSVDGPRARDSDCRRAAGGIAPHILIHLDRPRRI